MVRIKGLQKLTLLDFPGITACTVFLASCNFKCPFCHNRELVIDPSGSDLIAEEEFFSFLKKRKGIIEGVCVSGGEPLMQTEIGKFLADIKSLGYLVKLDTNGYFNEKLEEVLKSGAVDYVAMDIKNSLEKYQVTAGIRDFDKSRILNAIKVIAENAPAYEFRTTVTAEHHTVDDLKKIAEMLSPYSPRGYYIQPFRDSDGVIVKGLHAPTRETLDAMACASGGILRGI